MIRRLLLVFGLFLGLLASWACSKSTSPTPAPEISGQFELDPIFREMVALLGGQERLGIAISPKRMEGAATTQYLETAKLIYDPNAPDTSKFRFAPLGLDMAVREPPVPPPADPELHYVDGHTIFPDFYPLYEELGPEMVGKPLTEVRYNLIRKRYEQYFENLGFYKIEGSDKVRLLAYGAWACDDKCLDSQIPGSATVDITSYIDPVFQEFVSQYGADFTGFALVDAYNAQDGKWEQTLENVVVYADNRINPQNVGLRPLSEKLSIMPEEPRPKSDDPDMYFYPVEGDKGYEIPLYFWEYIQAHGGTQVFGLPITHYGLLMEQVYHQCYTNLCLTYDESASENARIRPEPLGYAYRVLYSPQASQPAATATPGTTSEPATTAAPVEAAAPTETIAPTAVNLPAETIPPAVTIPPVASPSSGAIREIALQVWERFMVVEQQQGQEIGIWVVENGQPVSDTSAEITVKMPDGAEMSFQMPPTDSAGQSSLLLPAIQASNGTIVPYKACILASPEMRVCVADFFVIWNSP